MRMPFRHFLVAVCVIGIVLSLTTMAQAHAVIFPRQVTAESYEKFVLRVPTEKDIPTVAVRVEVPEGFTVSRVQPLPGWDYELERNADGQVTAVSWTGGEIGPTEFQEFVFQGRTAADAGSYAWRAWQTYSDGTVVAWTGPSDADTPASVMHVVTSGAQTDAHGVTTDSQAAGAGTGANVVTSLAAYGGLVLGAIALVVALRRRPA